MRKVDGFTAIAPRLREGEVEYCLWTDENGALYVQILKNIIETPSRGSFSKRLFKVSDYIGVDVKPDVIRGVNPDTFEAENSGNKDDFYFVKAIVKQLVQ